MSSRIPGPASHAAAPLPWAAVVGALLATTIACARPEPAARIAVASNFRQAFVDLAEHFEARSGRAVEPSFGSTGKQFAQIRNGAPYAAFFAADVEHPRRLEGEGMAVTGSRFTYAVGRLVLWSPRPELVDADGAVLETDGFRHLAIANPDLAPYGNAARQVLISRGQWERLAGRLARGENVAQAYQYVASGNAEMGFVAYAQIVQHRQRPGEGSASGSFWEVPGELHDPIEQQAILVEENTVARAFLDFVATDEGRAIIRAHGYRTP